MAFDPAKLAAARAAVRAEAPPDEAPAQPIGERLDRLVGQFGSGGNRDLSKTLGFPVDTANAVLGAVGVPVSDEPFLGSKFIHERFMPTPQEPETALERVVDRIGGEVGAALPMLGAGLALRGAAAVAPFDAARGAASVAPFAERSAVAAGRIASPMLQTLANALASTPPSKLAAMETALAASSGTGAGVAREMFPDSPTAELAGQLVGTFGPAVAHSIVSRLTKSTLARLKAPQPEDLEREVGEIIDNATRDAGMSVTDGIAQRNQIRETIPGFAPTTAEVTNAPALIGMERAQTAASPTFKNAFRSRFSESGDAIKNAFERIPGIPKGQASIVDTQATIRRALDERLAAARAAAEQQIALRPRITTNEAGAIIRDQLTIADADFRTAANRLFDRVDEAGRVRLPFGDIVTEAAEMVERRPRFEAVDDTPDIARELHRFANNDAMQHAQQRIAELGTDASEDAVEALRRGAVADSTISFDELRSLRSRVLNDIRMEVGGTNNRNKVRKLEILRDRIEGTLDQLGDSEQFPDVAQSYREANAFYRDGVRRLRSGTVAEVMRRDVTGRMRVGENEVFSRFFRPGEKGLATAEDFNAAVRTPEGRAAFADAALNSLAETADTNGRLSATRLAAWRQKHADALRALPEIDAETRTIADAQRRLEQASLTAQRGVDEVERSAAGLMLNMDPDKAAARVLTGNRPAYEIRRMRQLIGTDRQALNGLRRAVWDHIGQAAEGGERSLFTDEALLHPTKLKALMRRHHEPLRALYSEEELRQLQTILRATEIAQRSAKPAVINSSATAENILSTPIFSPKQWFARTWGAVRPGKLRVAADVLFNWLGSKTKAITDENLRQIMDRALIDPDYAETLVMNARGVKPDTVVRMIRGHLVNLGGERRQEAAEDVLATAGKAGVFLSEQVESSVDDQMREWAPRRVKPPAPPKPAPPPPPPPLPKKPDTLDADRNMERLRSGRMTPGDLSSAALKNQQYEIARRERRDALRGVLPDGGLE